MRLTCAAAGGRCGHMTGERLADAATMTAGQVAWFLPLVVLMIAAAVSLTVWCFRAALLALLAARDAQGDLDRLERDWEQTPPARQ